MNDVIRRFEKKKLNLFPLPHSNLTCRLFQVDLVVKDLKEPQDFQGLQVRLAPPASPVDQEDPALKAPLERQVSLDPLDSLVDQAVLDQWELLDSPEDLDLEAALDSLVGPVSLERLVCLDFPVLQDYLVVPDKLDFQGALASKETRDPQVSLDLREPEVSQSNFFLHSSFSPRRAR